MIRCGEQPTCIGPFVVGEKPNMLSYQFLNFDWTVIDLTGFIGVYSVKEQHGVALERTAAIITPSNGTVTYVWQGDEFPIPGHYVSEFWVSSAGTRRFASVLILFDVRAPVGPVPVI